MNEDTIPTFRKRGSDRRAVSLRALASSGERDLAEVMLTDLSYEGCRIEGAEPLQSGERVELRVARLGIIDGEICWAAPGTAGMRFLG